jgi:ATP:cob(I)alamin adenosyltransferase
MVNIYTKTGDKGETSLVGGTRISKNSLRVSCYGIFDEVISMIGVAYSVCKNGEIKEILRDIQEQIFLLGGELASDEKGEKFLKEKIEGHHIKKLEEIIDYYTEKVGPFKGFVIPGKNNCSATLHVVRTIVRRGEREVIRLNKEEKIRDELLQYINRMSDAFFALAREEENNVFIQEVKERVINKLKDDNSKIIGLKIAKKMALAVEVKAKEMKVPVVFSVVDSGGNLILLHRMEDSLLASIELSINKAYTANALKLPTDEVSKLCQPGEMLYSLQNTDKIVAFGGGFPLKVGNNFIGGIGVSGGNVDEDMTIASNALRVFEMEK